jgi:hypothetical protein
MLTVAPPMPLVDRAAREARRFARWLRAHRSAATMAGLLAFAGPITFFTGALSVMRTPTVADLLLLGVWWLLYGVLLWCLLLVTGYGCEQVAPRLGRYARAAMWLLAASSIAPAASILTGGRVAILIEQGVVSSALTAHLYALMFSLIMALLYFAHLRRSRGQEHAAARLAAAQAAQRHARRRIVQSRLQEMQARIDPQLLFEMLDAVRNLYERDPVRAEHFLDELIVFLRAALPRLRTASSSLLREVELARAFVRLRALVGAAGLSLTVDVAAEAMHARFPPGVLLPLLDSAVSTVHGPCHLVATCSSEGCRLVLTLDAAPSPDSIARVRSLLMELHGTSAELKIESSAGPVNLFVEVPYELA